MPLPHPPVSSVGGRIVPGARNAAQVEANIASMSVAIPGEFWAELRQAGIISADAPVPRSA